jgi:hypothetical protein
LATIIWATYACTGESVELTEEDFAHIKLEHPDLNVDEQALKVTVEAPEICTLEVDGSLNFYRRGVIPRRAGRYLHVLVRRGGQTADLAVHTAWASKQVDHPYEEVLC